MMNTGQALAQLLETVGDCVMVMDGDNVIM